MYKDYQRRAHNFDDVRKNFLLDFSFDEELSEEELLIRAMQLGNPIEICKIFSPQELKEVFLRNISRFHGKDKNFWKIVLEVSDGEIE